jgi:hypothetical protein
VVLSNHSEGARRGREGNPGREGMPPPSRVEVYAFPQNLGPLARGVTFSQDLGLHAPEGADSLRGRGSPGHPSREFEGYGVTCPSKSPGLQPSALQKIAFPTTQTAEPSGQRFYEKVTHRARGQPRSQEGVHPSCKIFAFLQPGLPSQTLLAPRVVTKDLSGGLPPTRANALIGKPDRD